MTPGLQQLPLFPLGTVLFPGLVLPLHVFEERYRILVRRLLDEPDSEARRFGVVAIRQGWEVGSDGVHALYDVGTAALLRRVAAHEDGRFDVVTVGSARFRLHGVDDRSEPYLVGTVEWLDDTGHSGPSTADDGEQVVLAGSVRAVYARYLAELGTERPPDLPAEPLSLSYLVAASAPLDLDDRQALLAAPDTAARLRAELQLLKREATMLRRLRAVPVPLAELRVPMSVN